jgi:hypothetical protein
MQADIAGSITRSQVKSSVTSTREDVISQDAARGIHIYLVTVQPLLSELPNPESLDQESGRLSICRDVSRRN